MTPTPHTPSFWNRIRGRASAAFALSLLIHLSIFLLVGGTIILSYKTAHSPTFFDSTQQAGGPVSEIEAPEIEDTALDNMESVLQELEPDNQIPAPSEDSAPAPVVDAITTNTTSPFTLNALPGALGPSVNAPGTGGGGNGRGGKGGRGPGIPKMGSPFGMKSPSAPDGLTGYFYDLKQDRDRKPLDTDAGLFVRRFIGKWDEKALKDFYRAPEPLTAFQWFIPNMGADGAPRAFGVEKEVEPNRWLVFYQGRVTSAVTGTFRFVGRGDDVLIVRFDKKFVLDASWGGNDWEMNNEDRETNGPYLGNSDVTMLAGKWFKVKAGESYPMEVLIGEIPGTAFSIFLTIQEKGKTYEQRPDGQGLLLPVFQTGPIEPPAFEPGGNGPLIAPEPFVLGAGNPP